MRVVSKKQLTDRRTFLQTTAAGAGSLVFAAPAMASGASAPIEIERGMIFLYHVDPRFHEGLRRHGLRSSHGLRILNTGLEKPQFGEKWNGSTDLAAARSSGLFYYFDRIGGGTPYQSLGGIESVARDIVGFVTLPLRRVHSVELVAPSCPSHRRTARRMWSAPEKRDQLSPTLPRSTSRDARQDADCFLAPVNRRRRSRAGTPLRNGDRSSPARLSQTPHAIRMSPQIPDRA